MSEKGYNVFNKMKQWEKNGDVSRIIHRVELASQKFFYCHSALVYDS